MHFFAFFPFTFCCCLFLFDVYYQFMFNFQKQFIMKIVYYFCYIFGDSSAQLQIYNSTNIKLL